MKRRDFPARTKYSWSVKTFAFAASLSRVRIAGNRVRSEVVRRGSRRRGFPCRDRRARKKQRLCRRQPFRCSQNVAPARFRPMPRSLSRDRLVALLEASSRAHVTVVGDAMLDVYLRGEVERISPEA